MEVKADSIEGKGRWQAASFPEKFFAVLIMLSLIVGFGWLFVQATGLSALLGFLG
jgi:hypothetical protein